MHALWLKQPTLLALLLFALLVAAQDPAGSDLGTATSTTPIPVPGISSTSSSSSTASSTTSSSSSTSSASSTTTSSTTDSSTTSSTPTASSTTPPPTASPSSATPVPPATTTTSSPQSNAGPHSVIIISIISTLPNGQVSTSVSMSSQPIPTSDSGQSKDGGSNGKTWGIVGGVCAGVAAFALAAFLIFRCTQRRFSDLDDDDFAIKWPELVNRNEDPTTLNPLAARQGSGHGVGDDGDEEKAFIAGGGGGFNDSQTNFAPSRAGTINHSVPPNPPNVYAVDRQQPYYDPYLGSSSMSNSGYPPDGQLMSPGGMYGAPPFNEYNYSPPNLSDPVPTRTVSPGIPLGSGNHIGLDRRASVVNPEEYLQSWTGASGGEAIAMSPVGASQMSSNHSEQYWRNQDAGIETVAPVHTRT